MATVLPATDPRTLEGLRARRETICAIAAAHYASNLRVTGSVARGEATIESDIDLIVDIDRDHHLGFDYFGNLENLLTALAKELGCHVDVIDARTLRYYLDEAGALTDYKKHVARLILRDAVSL